MKAKRILSIAIIAALPMGAMAENISGAMYTAPARYDTNHPAPTTDAYAPYGRIDIDTADQEHIATTAYVKGAYNSAIAAVNKIYDNLSEVDDVFRAQIEGKFDDMYNQIMSDFSTLIEGKVDIDTFGPEIDNVYRAIDQAADTIGTKRVTIYTTWNDDSANATAQVALSSAQ